MVFVVNKHPYQSLGESAFWVTAVAKRNMFDIEGLWDPKFAIREHHRVVTFGSCFAQHMGRALSSRGFNWYDSEPAPIGLSSKSTKLFNYGVFSARTGNIYTVSLLDQWVGWASGEKSAPDELWEKDGRYYDPFRPNIEPNGFSSAEELRMSRDRAIQGFKECLTSANVFVFTLGLTESWVNGRAGYEYPLCPGTVAGVFDEDEHKFVNQGIRLATARLETAILKIRTMNPNVRFLLTVSPVPLTATNSGNHVLVATMESKSVLRTAAGLMARRFGFVDYFPSYEIINSPVFRGVFFEANQRSVNQTGVDHVMNSFFKCLDGKFPTQVAPAMRVGSPSEPRNALLGSEIATGPVGRDQDVICEEELLSAFGGLRTTSAATQGGVIS